MAKSRKLFGPQHVGGVFRNAYWGYEYTVLKIEEDLCRITIQITKPGKVGTVGEVITHMTGWNYDRDTVVSYRSC